MTAVTDLEDERDASTLPRRFQDRRGSAMVVEDKSKCGRLLDCRITFTRARAVDWAKIMRGRDTEKLSAVRAFPRTIQAGGAEVSVWVVIQRLKPEKEEEWAPLWPSEQRALR